MGPDVVREWLTTDREVFGAVGERAAKVYGKLLVYEWEAGANAAPTSEGSALAKPEGRTCVAKVAVSGKQKGA